MHRARLASLLACSLCLTACGDDKNLSSTSLTSLASSFSAGDGDGDADAGDDTGADTGGPTTGGSADATSAADTTAGPSDPTSDPSTTSPTNPTSDPSTSDPTNDPSDPTNDPSTTSPTNPTNDPSDPTNDPSDPTNDPSDPTNDPSETTDGTTGVDDPVAACKDYYDPATPCTTCLCENCTDIWQSCQDDPDCKPVIDCFQESGCTDFFTCIAACQSVIDMHGGNGGPWIVNTMEMTTCQQNLCSLECF